MDYSDTENTGNFTYPELPETSLRWETNYTIFIYTVTHFCFIGLATIL